MLGLEDELKLMEKVCRHKVSVRPPPQWRITWHWQQQQRLWRAPPTSQHREEVKRMAFAKSNKSLIDCPWPPINKWLPTRCPTTRHDTGPVIDFDLFIVQYCTTGISQQPLSHHSNFTKLILVMMMAMVTKFGKSIFPDEILRDDSITLNPWDLDAQKTYRINRSRYKPSEMRETKCATHTHLNISEYNSKWVRVVFPKTYSPPFLPNVHNCLSIKECVCVHLFC